MPECPCASASHNSVCWFLQRSCAVKLVKTPACVKPRFCSRKRCSRPSRSLSPNISFKDHNTEIPPKWQRCLLGFARAVFCLWIPVWISGRKKNALSFLDFVITWWTVGQSDPDGEPAAVLDGPPWETSLGCLTPVEIPLCLYSNDYNYKQVSISVVYICYFITLLYHFTFLDF